LDESYDLDESSEEEIFLRKKKKNVRRKIISESSDYDNISNNFTIKEINRLYE